MERIHNELVLWIRYDRVNNDVNNENHFKDNCQKKKKSHIYLNIL